MSRSRLGRGNPMRLPHRGATRPALEHWLKLGPCPFLSGSLQAESFRCVSKCRAAAPGVAGSNPMILIFLAADPPWNKQQQWLLAVNYVARRFVRGLIQACGVRLKPVLCLSATPDSLAGSRHVLSWCDLVEARP